MTSAPRIPRLAVTLAAMLALALLPVGLAQMDGMDHDDAMDTTMDHDAIDHESMDHGMMMEPVVDEYSFIAGMIPHHQEAVDVGLYLFANTHRPEMRDFAWGIVTSQLAEIETMKGWLAAWYPERSGDAMYAPMMRDLTNLDPDALDRVFLEDMIPHHEGAVMMSLVLLDNGYAEHPEVAALARSILVVQRDEIEQMHAWLAAWF